MPLSDEEERVIAAIERQFAKESAVVRVRSAGGPPRRRPLLQPALLSVGSLALTVVGFTSHVIVGVIGFLSLVVSMMALCRSVLDLRPE